MRRTLWILGATVFALAAVAPASVLLAAKVGLAPTHWSGTHLVAVELPFDLDSGFGDAPPESAAQLLSQAAQQDQGDTGDLAPSWYDAGAQEVVLGAVTARGEQMRRALTTGVTTAWRIGRVAHSVRALDGVANELIELSEYGIFMTYADGEHNCVVATTSRLSQSLFDAVGRYGDAVVVRYAPLEPMAGLGGTPDPGTAVEAPSTWSRMDPPGTWWVLATGFPWHLGAIGAIAVGFWAYPALRRRFPRQQWTPTRVNQAD